jgi:hypothetical protein
MSTVVCPQCGFIHPPVTGKCPMAKEVKEGETSKQDIDFDPFLRSIKSILISQCSKKNIKKFEKLLAGLTVEITKFLENYKEES